MTTVGKHLNLSLSANPKLGHKLLRVKILTVQPGASCPGTASSPEEPPAPDAKAMPPPHTVRSQASYHTVQNPLFPHSPSDRDTSITSRVFKRKMKQKEHLTQFMPHFGRSQRAAPSSPAIPRHVAGRTVRARHPGKRAKGEESGQAPAGGLGTNSCLKKEKKININYILETYHSGKFLWGVLRGRLSNLGVPIHSVLSFAQEGNPVT